MSAKLVHHTLNMALIGCTLLVGAAQAQNRPRSSRPSGTVHQMQILDGSRQSIRYFSRNLSPSESSTLRELERLENESSYVQDLQELKRQLVISERQLETHRRLVQMLYYGVETSRNRYDTVYAGAPSVGRTGYYGYPFNYTSPYAGSATVGAVASDTITETRGLSQGVGPESRITEALAAVLAQQATPEYAARIDRSLDLAALRATASPSLRLALNLPTPEQTREVRTAIRMASEESGSPRGMVTLTLKGGEIVQGTKMIDKGDWIYLEKSDGSQERIRQSEVVRMQIPKVRGGIVPAVTD